MKASDARPPETFTFDFAKRRFPVWFRPEESTRQAAVVSYMHAHQLSLTRVYAKTGCSRHFCCYRFVSYDDPAAIPGPVESCGWIDASGPEPGCRLPQGFVYRPGRAIPILQAAFDRTPDPAPPIGGDPVHSPRFAGGRGTAEDPYRVSSAEDLLLLSYLSNHRVYTGVDPTLAEEIGDSFADWSRGKYFKLTRDIVWNDPARDPAEGVSFPIICNRNAAWGRSAFFAGTFDGAGHFIRGLYVSEDEEKKRYPSDDYAYNNGVSLFGALHGTVKNLAITDSYFSGSGRVAAIAGVLCLGGAVENCLADNRLCLKGTAGDRNAGGLIGFSVNGSVSRSVVGGEICGSIYSNVCFLGGIFGAVATGAALSTSVTDCFVFASMREQIDPTVRRDHPALLSPHDEKRVEIIRVTEGVLNVRIRKDRYVGVPGSVFVVNPYDFFQAFVSPSDAKRTSVDFFSFSLPEFVRQEDSPFDLLFSDNPGHVRFANVIPPSDPGFPGVTAAIDYLFENKGKTTDRPLSFVPAAVSEKLRLRAGVWRFVSEMAEHGLMSLSVDQKEQKNAKFRTEMIRYIEDNYRGDLSTETAARFFFFSKSYFCRRFRQEFGLPFAVYLQNFRIRKSKQLDPAHFPSLSALAASVGFPSYYHFERVFRKWMGMTPRAYFETVRRAGGPPVFSDDDFLQK